MHQLHQHYHQQQQAAQNPQPRRRVAVKKTFPTLVSASMRDRQARGKNAYKKHEDDLTDEGEADDDEDLEEMEELEEEEEEEDEYVSFFFLDLT